MKNILTKSICTSSLVIVALSFWLSMKSTHDQKARELANVSSAQLKQIKRKTAVLGAKNSRSFSAFEEIIKSRQDKFPYEKVAPKIQHNRN